MRILRHFPARTEASWVPGHFLAEIKSENNAPGRLAQCRRVCDFLEARQIYGSIVFLRTNSLIVSLKLLEEHLIEFNALAIKNSSGDEDILNRVMPKDNIALAAVFRTIVPNNGQFCRLSLHEKRPFRLERAQ